MSCHGGIRQSRRNLSLHCGKRVASGTCKSNNYLLFFINLSPHLKMISDCAVEQVLSHIISDSELFVDPVQESEYTRYFLQECRKHWITNDRKERSLTFTCFLIVSCIEAWELSVFFFMLFLEFWQLRYIDLAVFILQTFYKLEDQGIFLEFTYRGFIFSWVWFGMSESNHPYAHSNPVSAPHTPDPSWIVRIKE